MSKTNPYPGCWYVCRLSDAGWTPLGLSVGSKSWALGYATCAISYTPRPSYRLIDAEGDVFLEWPGVGGVDAGASE